MRYSRVISVASAAVLLAACASLAGLGGGSPSDDAGPDGETNAEASADAGQGPDASGSETAPAPDAPACPSSCPVFTTCSAGACACQRPLAACDAGCSDLSTDPYNCGQCGKRCTNSQRCVDGGCACVSGSDPCPTGSPTSCVPRGTENNCYQSPGVRCYSCSVFAETCINDSCQSNSTQCPSGQTRCGSSSAVACVDLQKDPVNCGICMKQCAGGELCVDGECVMFKPVIDCGSCPCDVQCSALVGSVHRCCSMTGFAQPVCVAGTSCPP